MLHATAIDSRSPLSPLSIDNEVERLRRGDLDAFDALLARLKNRLFRYLLRLVGEPATAEDLFQQCWLKAMTHLHRYDRRRSFDPWLFAIARNLAIDHLRRKKAQSLDDPLESGEPASMLLPATEPGALERLLQKERRQFLAERVAELPLVYREALTLRFEEEMSFEEIAEVMGTPLSTAKSRVQRAVRALRLDLAQREREKGQG